MSVENLVGIDPAVGVGSRVGVAVLEGDTLIECHSIRTVGKFEPGQRALVIARAIEKLSFAAPATFTVEGQKYYKHKKQSSPQGLISLAQVAGAIAGVLCVRPWNTVRLPLPQDVSTLSKSVRHKQALYKMGIDEAYVASKTRCWKINAAGEGYPDTAKLDMNDVLDAVCLARWGGKQNKKEKK